ncbi:histidine phosphatase family protein [Nocardioides terrisoli]|uniref:histidine phosphatase family protein n=1 Tax=Nocardioides terrisoli TaxID=3388267 RepID=UPI00287BAAC0|nr:histidine phosphatase family protein [Nocardioides marmorisolisilvae]
MRLLLLRHGQTHSNVSGALDTDEPGAPLTDLGHAQADAAATVLADRGVDAIFTSTLLRTAQTAAPLADRLGLSPVVLPGLREIRAGDQEMRTDDAARDTYLHTVATWLFGQPEERMPGGETGVEFLARYDAAIDSIARSGAGTALVVSHGAAIRTWVGLRATDEGSGEWADVALEPMRNTGCIELERTDDSWLITAWNNHPIGGDLLEDPTAQDPTGRAPLD